MARIALILSLGLWFATSPAFAEKRVALVIGNSAYARVGKLENPARDAGAVEKVLRHAGFETVEVMRDLGNSAMRRALRDFSDQARDADIAVVFYAGHGIEVNGSNYLIPVDAVLERDLDVEDETVPLERVSQVLEQTKRLRLVILDACRDNPFVRSMRRTIGSRSIGRGLAKVEVLTIDTLIAFAAKAGSTAEDGRGSNSPYTTALVKHLATPGLDVRLAFGRVRDEVLRSTKGKQEPVYYGSLGGAEIALVPAAPSLPPSVDVDAARVCREVEGMSNATVLAVMADKHKGTLAAGCIAARLEQLQKAEAAKTAAAERLCQGVRAMADVSTLKAMAGQHKGTPAEACIAARIVELELLQRIHIAPKPPSAASSPQEWFKEAIITPEAQRLSPKRAPAPLTAAEERGLRPKDKFKECPDCPEMVVVPAGSFTMGSPPSEEGRSDDEVQRQYTFARPFAVGRFEVTRAEWTACYADRRCGGFFKKEQGRQPAFMSWENAAAYATWLSGKTGKEYRLLTGAEWEYAARAGTTTRYAFGNTITERQAKFSADGSWQVPFVWRPFTWDDVEVGSFPPNAWGLHDMHGNVWEWCSDESSKVVSGNAFETRMLRGGSWNSPPEDLRSARRRWHFPLVSERDVGLRVARTL
jgi:formylglycine-generating enzyme required for sulfatase activity